MKDEDREKRPQALERNVEEFPLFGVSKKEQPSVLTFNDAIVDQDGSRVEQYWRIAMPAGESLPAAFDRDVYFAVMEMVLKRGGIPSNGTMDFSLYELAGIMSRDTGGKTLKSIASSLRRISRLSIDSEAAFYLFDEKRRVSETLGIWDVRLDESKTRQGEKRSRHRIHFREFFRRSYEQMPVAVDAGLYWSLSKPLSKALYCFIETERGEKTTFGWELFDLAARLPLGPYDKAYRIRERLKPAHEELLEAGYLAEASYPYSSSVSYRLSGDYLKELSMPDAGEWRRDLSARERHALELLLSYRVRSGTARSLVESHGPRACEEAIRGLEREKEMSRGIKNPAGWLRSAIERGYRFETSQESLSPPVSRDEEAERRREGYEWVFFNQNEIPSGGASSSLTEDVRETQETREVDPDPQAQKVWEQVLEGVRETINAPSLNTWFKGVVAVGIKGDVLEVSVPNSFAREYIESRFLGDLERSLSGVLGREGTITVVERSVEEG